MSEGPYVRNTAVLVSAAASPLSVSETKDQAYNCRVEGKQLQGLPSARPANNGNASWLTHNLQKRDLTRTVWHVIRVLQGATLLT